MTFIVWVYTSQDFAQTQQNFARSHDRVTVTFRNSGVVSILSALNDEVIMLLVLKLSGEHTTSFEVVL